MFSAAFSYSKQLIHIEILIVNCEITQLVLMEPA